MLRLNSWAAKSWGGGGGGGAIRLSNRAKGPPGLPATSGLVPGINGVGRVRGLGFRLEG